MLIPIPLPQFICFPKSALNPVPILREIKLSIFQDSHLKLDQYITSESHIDKLVSFSFKEIELRQDCDFEPQICDPVQNSENRLGFLPFSVGIHIFLSFLLYYYFIFRLCIRIERFRERKREIDVIDGDNLCKSISFLLHYNLLYLLHDS